MLCLSILAHWATRPVITTSGPYPGIYTNWVVQWLVDASSVAASGCHRWLALLGERVSKMCKSHLAST